MQDATLAAELYLPKYSVHVSQKQRDISVQARIELLEISEKLSTAPHELLTREQ